MVMALFTKSVAIVAALLVFASCGGDKGRGVDGDRTPNPGSSVSQGPSPLAVRDDPQSNCPIELVDPTKASSIESPALALGAPIQAKVVTNSADDAQGWVPGGSFDHQGFAPVGPYGAARLLVHDNQTRGRDNAYFSWQPGTEPTPVWAIREELQDIAAEGIGSKIVTVRHGFEAPMAEWQLIVRAPDGSGGCVLARSNPAAYSRNMMQLGFPGLAPRPVVAGDLLIWAERFVGADGTQRKRVVLYNLASSELQTLAEIDDITESDLWSPSVSGRAAGWLEQPVGGNQPVQVVLSLTDRVERRFALPEQPATSALLNDGRHLALALQSGQFVAALEDGVSVKVLDFGAWMYSSGRYSSWAPVTGHVGYYDAQENTIHLIDTKGAETVDAYVMGSFFVWQEFRNVPKEGGSPGQTLRESRFFAIKL